MRKLIFIMALAGCAQSQPVGPGAVSAPAVVYQPPVVYQRPMPQLWQGLDPEPFLRRQQAPPIQQTTWCRPDGYGGMYCS